MDLSKAEYPGPPLQLLKTESTPLKWQRLQALHDETLFVVRSSETPVLPDICDSKSHTLYLYRCFSKVRLGTSSFASTSRNAGMSILGPCLRPIELETGGGALRSAFKQTF